MRLKFGIKGLDCANCAAELEEKIKKIAGVKSASISYMMETLLLEIEDIRKDEILDEVKKIIKKEEPDVNLIEK